MLFFLMFIGAAVIGLAAWISSRNPSKQNRKKQGSVGHPVAAAVPPKPPSAMPPTAPTGDPLIDAVRRQMKLNQWDEARRLLQKVAYGMVDAKPNEKAAFTELMKEFAIHDPLFSAVLRIVMPLVREQPGLLQSGIYKHLPGIGQEEARYALYFGEQLGLLRRVKKGNSYRLYEPGAVVEMEVQAKPNAKRLRQKAGKRESTT